MESLHQVMSAHIEGHNLSLNKEGLKVGGESTIASLMRSCMKNVPQIQTKKKYR